jgi:hypothetical protein
MDRGMLMERIRWSAGVSFVIIVLLIGLLGCGQEFVEDPVGEGASLAPSSAVIIDLSGSLFEVVFNGVTGSTWCYTVTKLEGNNADFWMFTVDNFDIPDWLDHIVDASPPDYVKGKDEETGYIGIKWPLPADFESGQFCFTLDRDYTQSAIITFPRKGSQFSKGEIIGPGSPEGGGIGEIIIHDQGIIIE